MLELKLVLEFAMDMEFATDFECSVRIPLASNAYGRILTISTGLTDKSIAGVAPRTTAGIVFGTAAET